MKKCPKNCGLFQDYETKCPNCGARLLKVKDNQAGTNSQNTANPQNTASGTTQAKPVQPVNNVNYTNSTGGADTRGYDFGGGAVRNPFTPQFMYNTHIYGQQQSGCGVQNVQQQAPASAPVNVNNYSANNAGYNQSAGQRKNVLRGKVKNCREAVMPMSKVENVLYSTMHGTRMTNSDRVVNFQLIELDQNDNQTGRIYSVILRGEIVVGHFYDGNVVQVEGKQGRGGEIYAKDVYNESSACVVKIRRNLFPL